MRAKHTMALDTYMGDTQIKEGRNLLHMGFRMKGALKAPYPHGVVYAKETFLVTEYRIVRYIDSKCSHVCVYTLYAGSKIPDMLCVGVHRTQQLTLPV